MTTTIETELESSLDAARSPCPVDATRERPRVSRILQPLAVVAVLLALGGGVVSVHLQANARAEQANDLSVKASTEQDAANALKQSAGTKSDELADLINRIDGARSEIARKEPLQ